MTINRHHLPFKAIRIEINVKIAQVKTLVLAKQDAHYSKNFYTNLNLICFKSPILTTPHDLSTLMRPFMRSHDFVNRTRLVLACKPISISIFAPSLAKNKHQY